MPPFSSPDEAMLLKKIYYLDGISPKMGCRVESAAAVAPVRSLLRIQVNCYSEGMGAQSLRSSDASPDEGPTHREDVLLQSRLLFHEGSEFPADTLQRLCRSVLPVERYRSSAELNRNEIGLHRFFSLAIDRLEEWRDAEPSGIVILIWRLDDFAGDVDEGQHVF